MLRLYATAANDFILKTTDAAASIVAFTADAALAAAVEGAAANRPKPNDATATSAMRLKVVFVDICFLSIKVDPRAFPESAW